MPNKLIYRLVCLATIFLIFGSLLGTIPTISAAPATTPAAGGATSSWGGAGLANFGTNAITASITGGWSLAAQAAFCAFEGLIVGALGGMVYATNYLVSLQVLGGNNIGDPTVMPDLIDAWKMVRNLGISLLTLALIIIALANIFNVKTEEWGLNRMIPKIIISIVMAYFSIVLVRFLLDFFSALQVGILSSSWGNNNIGDIITAWYKNSYNNGIVQAAFNCIGTNIVSQGLKLLLYIILFIVILIICIYLIILVYFRTVMLWFLLIVAPLAFLMNILPFTESLYKQWWQTFWKWALIGPAVSFGLWFAGMFLKAYSTTNPSGPDFTFLIMFGCSLFIAAAFPTMLGGTIMKMIAKPIQGYMKKGGALAQKGAFDTAKRSKTGQLIGGVLDNYKKNRAMKIDATTAHNKAKVQEKIDRHTAGMNDLPIIGPRVTITGEEQESLKNLTGGEKEGWVRKYGADIKDLSTAEIVASLKKIARGTVQEEAYLRTLAERKDFSPDEDTLSRISERLDGATKIDPSTGQPVRDDTGGAVGIAFKVNNPKVLVSAAKGTTGAAGKVAPSAAAHEMVLKRVGGKPITEWEGDEVKYLAGNDKTKQVVLDALGNSSQQDSFYKKHGKDVTDVVEAIPEFEKKI